jgi:hypothetical protein
MKIRANEDTHYSTVAKCIEISGYVLCRIGALQVIEPGLLARGFELVKR